MNRELSPITVLMDPSESEIHSLTERRGARDPRLEETVEQIMAAVRKSGDEALGEFTRRFDGCLPRPFLVDARTIHDAGKALTPELKGAIETARRSIRKFHAYNQAGEGDGIQTLPGVECFQKRVPIDRVGLYIPGGTHPLFSSLLMLGIPAALAGCRDVVVCTPPDASGAVHPAVLYCAGLLGIEWVFRVGGAQAVAAMAYGTESVPAVNKIFGPGNDFVTEAKMQALRDGVAVDMPAGPSELMVLADGEARPGFVAADLLSQLEHGRNSRAVLISLDREKVDAVHGEILGMVQSVDVNDFVRENLGHTTLMYVDSEERALRILNEYAPEHLSLAVSDPERWVEGVRNAGSVFLGACAPEAVGDYASGTNHTLPTGGYAKSYSGITVDSFRKTISFQRLSPRGLREVARTVELMAEAENLPMHARSVALRRRSLDEETPGSMMAVDLLARHVRNLEPYSCARAQVTRKDDILLDANELPVSLVRGEAFNRYPDPLQKALSTRVAAMESRKPEEVLLGNGSDELIDLLVRGFCLPGKDKILVTPPTYGMYAVCARGLGVGVLEAPLKTGFSLDVEALLRLVSEECVKLIFLTSPNNPTGNLLETRDILDVARSSGAVVVVDEAYIDFSRDPGLAARIGEFPNLFVLRTFSKSWGAAGIRVGVLYGDAGVLEVFRKIKAPYNISGPNQAALERVLDQRSERTRVITQLVAERDLLARNLDGLDCVARVYPSQANFLLVEFKNCLEVFAHLSRCGLRVRDRSDLPGCAGCLRISVGMPEQNRRLLERLAEISGGEI